ncbi:MAG: helix-turn-helix domain-containing protein [Chloroflexota bacterium]|nr:helix-turn-helix domain-containing protein [Chloroflexota bacterium]
METTVKSLRLLRRERLYTTQGLARRAGVARDTITQCEAGRRTPELSTISKLSRALGVEPAEVREFAKAIEGETS